MIDLPSEIMSQDKYVSFFAITRLNRVLTTNHVY